MTVTGNPDTFTLTDEERDGIALAAATQSAADPRTKAAVASIVARFPRQPVGMSLAVEPHPLDPNPTYAATGGLSALGVTFDWRYEYEPVTFIGRLYRGGVSVSCQVGGAYRWITKGGQIGLAYASGLGAVATVFSPDQISGELTVGVQVEYDISKFTRYRNVGTGLLCSTETFSDPFTLTGLQGDQQ